MESIISYKERGLWGNNKYRGNCSGHVIKDLLQFLQPKNFIEVFAGGGTGLDVARSLGYDNSIHLDLNGRFGQPFNALIDEMPQGSDFVFSHPPYHSIIKYSGEQWGSIHPDDLSRCITYEEFIHKLNIVNSKIYNSLVLGGRHATLVGDIRKDGVYYSILKDMAFYGDLESHIIKVQHNYNSKNKKYNGNFIPIVHEHLLVFKKNHLWSIPITKITKVEKNLKNSLLATWRDLVYAALQSLNGKAKLIDIYNYLRETDKAKKNQHFEAKIRQILQKHNEFQPVDRGLWALVI